MADVIALLMDVEDPVNPESDGAAVACAKAMSELKIKGSICLTGEKIRAFAARWHGPWTEEFAPHALGLHTDRHSAHPTTMELLEGCDWEGGLKAAIEDMLPGLRVFHNAFGRLPTFWGGAGNTWAPQVDGALSTFGIPIRVYSLTWAPQGAPHKMGDVLALPQVASISEDDLADDGRASEAWEQVSRTLKEYPHRFACLFAGHPTRFRFAEFWDKSYYHGVSPQRIEPARPRLVKESRHILQNFRSLLAKAASTFSIVGLDDVAGWPWNTREVSPAEFGEAERKTVENIRAAAKWIVHRPDLTTRRIELETLKRLSLMKVAELPAGFDPSAR
jgi:hypothetical protein